MSIKNIDENNLKEEIPKFLRCKSCFFAFVSLTKYQAKNVSNSLVMIAEKMRGLKMVITKVTAKLHRNIGL